MEIDARGTKGVLAILWNPQVISHIYFLTKTHSITAEYYLIGTLEKGYITIVYGPNIPTKNP